MFEFVPSGLINEHETHGHGPPNFFAKIDLSFKAGPNFKPNEFVKCSSVNIGSPEPSICWSRKFCKKKNKEKKN